MTSVRKRGASGNDDDVGDVESTAFLMDSSMSKTVKVSSTIQTKKQNEHSQRTFQWITIAFFGAVVFGYSLNGTLQGRLVEFFIGNSTDGYRSFIYFPSSRFCHSPQNNFGREQSSYLLKDTPFVIQLHPGATWVLGLPR